MKFNHVIFERELVTLKQVNENGSRHYVVPGGGKYPSVTTVLAEHSRVGIQEWRNRVGNEEANKISGKASTRGTRLHKACEDYLNNKEPEFRTPLERVLFNSVIPELHKINNIHSQEVRLYSNYLRMAGTVDCIGEYNGKVGVIDFKSSSKIKEKNYIKNYFMQCAAYSIMYEELYKIPINRLVVIIGVEDELPQVFEERRDTWVRDLLYYRDLYESRNKDK